MKWDDHKATWPNAAHSTFVKCRPHTWHVQIMGNGPTVLLLHGAFGATQSWRDVLPLLAQRFRVIAVDLPGQGFSSCGDRRRLSVPRLATDLAKLAEQEGWDIDMVVGHSAGAVLGLELAHRLQPQGLVGLNAALGKFDGVAGWLFPVMAKALALNPLAAPLLVRMPGARDRVCELLQSTGSDFDDRMVDLYTVLATDRAHISGTIAMMAAWNIDAVRAKLPQLQTPCLLLAGEMDRTVLPKISEQAATRLPNAKAEILENLGHLMHEEAPDLICARIFEFAKKIGVLEDGDGHQNSDYSAVS